MTRTAPLDWRLPPKPMHPHAWQAWRLRDALPVGTRVMVADNVRGAGTVVAHRTDLEGWLVPVIALDDGGRYSSAQWGEMPGRVVLLLDEEVTQQKELFA